jgi:hypothetical protein
MCVDDVSPLLCSPRVGGVYRCCLASQRNGAYLAARGSQQFNLACNHWRFSRTDIDSIALQPADAASLARPA